MSFKTVLFIARLLRGLLAGLLTGLLAGLLAGLRDIELRRVFTTVLSFVVFMAC